MSWRKAALGLLLVAGLWSAPGVSAAGAPATERPARRRVLLFAGSASREYQFLRTVLVREMEKRRADLSIFIQPPPGGKPRTGVVQDVPPQGMLTEFPARLDGFDLIITFDADWSRLKPAQLALLPKWVERGGGLVLVAGPVNTRELTRPASAPGLKPLLDVCPVEPADSRLEEYERPTSRPWRLHFPKVKDVPAFLKLDAGGKGPLAGWDKFFGPERVKGKEVEPERGFYAFYPVKRIKKGATVLATFGDPRARTADGKPQPFLAVLRHGKGRVVWLGSGETWRLRAYSDTYHERFWTGLVAYAAKARP